MSQVKLKKGAEANVGTLAKEEGSLIFGLNGAEPSTMYLDATVNVGGSSSLQRLGIAVEQAKDSSAIGGSSISDIQNAINKATGSGEAFTSVNAATSSTLIFGKASGDTITRVVDNVGNAANASSLGGYPSIAQATGTSQTYVSKIPVVQANGAIDIGKFVDFHGTSASTDYDVRVDATAKTLTVQPSVSSTVTAAYFNGNARNATNAGTATYATNAGTAQALGSSSLKNITDAIDEKIGNSTAFVGVDTGNSSTLTFTRANGGSVSRVVNNVANANSAVYATNAGTATYATNAGTATHSNVAGALQTSANGTSTLSQILNQVSGRNAFVTLSTVTDDKVVLVNGLGSTSQKTVDNVAHANQATYAISSSSAKVADNATYSTSAGALYSSVSESSSTLDNIIDRIVAAAGTEGAFVGVTGDDATLTFTRASQTNPVTITVDNVANSTNSSQLMGRSAASPSSQDSNYLYTDLVGKIPVLSSSTYGGALDIGHYVDFHRSSNTNSTNYDLRLDGATTNLLKVISSGNAANTTVQAGYFSGVASAIGDATGSSSLSQLQTALTAAGSTSSFSTVSVNNATITLKRLGNTNPASFTVNNVANASTASYANSLQGYSITTSGSGTSATFSSHVPVVLSNGGMEIGKFIDFHGTKTSTDYDVRLLCDNSNELLVEPSSASTLTAQYFNGYANGISDGTTTNMFSGAAISSFIKNVTDSSGGSSGGTSIVVGNAYRLVNYEAEGTSGDASFFYRIGKPSGGKIAWTYFPSTKIQASGTSKTATDTLGSTLWASSDLMIAHFAYNTMAHDLVFLSTATGNSGIAYAAGGRDVALILDTANYKTKGNVFNSLVATEATCSTVKAAYSSAQYSSAVSFRAITSSCTNSSAANFWAKSSSCTYSSAINFQAVNSSCTNSSVTFLKAGSGAFSCGTSTYPLTLNTSNNETSIQFAKNNSVKWVAGMGVGTGSTATFGVWNNFNATTPFYITTDAVCTNLRLGVGAGTSWVPGYFSSSTTKTELEIHNSNDVTWALGINTACSENRFGFWDSSTSSCPLQMAGGESWFYKKLNVWDGSVSRVSAWADSEGGNIRIVAPTSANNRTYEFDAYNGNLRVYTADSNGGNYHGVDLLEANGYSVFYKVSVGQNSTLQTPLQFQYTGDQCEVWYLKSGKQEWSFGPGCGGTVLSGRSLDSFGFWKEDYGVMLSYGYSSNLDGNKGVCLYSNIDMRGFSVSNQSDARVKNSISCLDDTLSEKLLDSLIPSQFKYNSDEKGKIHYGFIAQEVQKALSDLSIDENSLSLFVKAQKYDFYNVIEKTPVVDEDGPMFDDNDQPIMEDTIQENGLPIEGDYNYSLVYTEFIALNTKNIQINRNYIHSLQSSFTALQTSYEAACSSILDLSARLAKLESLLT